MMRRSTRGGDREGLARNVVPTTDLIGLMQTREPEAATRGVVRDVDKGGAELIDQSASPCRWGVAVVRRCSVPFGTVG